LGEILNLVFVSALSLKTENRLSRYINTSTSLWLVTPNKFNRFIKGLNGAYIIMIQMAFVFKRNDAMNGMSKFLYFSFKGGINHGRIS